MQTLRNRLDEFGCLNLGRNERRVDRGIVGKS